MRFPRRFLGSALIFLGSAALIAALGMGASWVAHRQWPARQWQAAQNRPAGAARADAQALGTALLTGEECAAMVRDLPGESLWALIRARDAGFWQSNPNAAPFLRQAGRGLAEPPERILGTLQALFEERALSKPTIWRLLGAAFSGVLEAHPLSQQEFTALLSTRDKAEALALLEIWLDYQKPGSPRSDLATAIAIAGSVFKEVDEPLKDDLTAMIVRLWAHRAPSVAEALLFAKDIERPELQTRLLIEGARILAVANPGELQRQLRYFGPQMVEPAAEAAREAGLPFAQVFELAGAMPEKARGEFLGRYLSQTFDVDPREMLKVGAAYPAAQLPRKAAGIVANGFARSGDYGGLQTWMAGLDSKARAELWDATTNTGFPGTEMSAADARTFLANRPNDVPAGYAMREALSVLPKEDATRALEGVWGLEDFFKRQLEDEIAEREFRRLRTEDPAQVPAFLATLPKGRAQQFLENAFRRQAGMGALEAWAAESTVPAVREALEAQRLKGEINAGSLAAAETLALGYVQNGAAAGGREGAINELIGRLCEIDSSRGAAFLARLPAGELRDKSTATFIRKWAELDPVAASDWLAQTPSTPGRDLAVRELVACTRDDPERALANAAGIQNPKLRLEAARSVLRVWRDADPTHAANLLAQAGFSAAELPALRAMLGLGDDDNGGRP